MNHTRGILLALASFFLWVLVDTAVKLGGQNNFSPFAIMGVLNMTGVVLLLLRAVATKNFGRLRVANWRLQTIIAADMIFINYTNTIALKHLPLTIFYIVVFTMPLAVAAGAALCKHEVLTTKKIACLVTGFMGVLVAIAPRLNMGGEWIGYLAGWGSVVGFVYYTLLVRSFSATLPIESLLFWNMVPSASFGFLCAPLAVTHASASLLAILIAGGAINVFSNNLYNKALRLTSSTNVVQVHYTQILFGPVVGYMIWNEVPTWNLLVGALLIIAAGCVVAKQAHHDDRAAMESPL